MARHSLEELYDEVILDHRRSPRNCDVLVNPETSAKAVNPFCGDEVELQLVFENGRVSAVGVQAVGCSINQATSSILSEALLGKNSYEIGALSDAFKGMLNGQKNSRPELGDLGHLSAVRQYPVRTKCALLSWSALEDALDNGQEE